MFWREHALLRVDFSSKSERSLKLTERLIRIRKIALHDEHGYGEDFDADVAVAMRLTDFVLEGPAAIGLKRTDPEAVPQRMYTSDYDSASGAEEHEEAADAAASTTHST